MKFLDPKEISTILNISYRKVLDLIHMGDLKAIQIGSKYRISDIDLRAFIESSKVESPWK
ncbi:MAG: helix-turn-helix domain-containing protein [Cytophagia bacterium]|jgi:excisionase family DNA binding protein|nr:helix-turn-helix domain-containing protein [Candidatus Neomarinimicrobiota bacterium]MBT5530862.1 helix-turn-helix domain-containing protein [Cytophagia bacterium]